VDKSGHDVCAARMSAFAQSGHFDAIASLQIESSFVPYAWEFNVPDYIFFMHDDARGDENDWEPYLAKLKNRGSFEGGSAIGNGVCVRKSGAVPS
jgi:hypothetical protein